MNNEIDNWRNDAIGKGLDHGMYKEMAYWIK